VALAVLLSLVAAVPGLFFLIPLAHPIDVPLGASRVHVTYGEELNGAVGLRFPLPLGIADLWTVRIGRSHWIVTWSRR
jgi:hypothetical protein